MATTTTTTTMTVTMTVMMAGTMHDVDDDEDDEDDDDDDDDFDDDDDDGGGDDDDDKACHGMQWHSIACYCMPCHAMARPCHGMKYHAIACHDACHGYAEAVLCHGMPQRCHNYSIAMAKAVRWCDSIDRYVATVPGAQEVSEAWRLILLDPVEHLRHLQDYVTYQVQ